MGNGIIGLKFYRLVKVQYGLAILPCAVISKATIEMDTGIIGIELYRLVKVQYGLVIFLCVVISNATTDMGYDIIGIAFYRPIVEVNCIRKITILVCLNTAF